MLLFYRRKPLSLARASSTELIALKAIGPF